MQIEPFDPIAASEPELAALHRFTSALQLELLPDDPPTPLEVALRAWRNPSGLVTTSTWLAREDDAVVGRAQLIVGNTRENAHVGKCSVQVAAANRRRGIARALSVLLVAAARASGRTLLVAETSGRIAAGAEFARRIGAHPGLEATTRQLAVAGLDRGLLERWCAQGLDQRFEIREWPGALPEAELEAIAALHEVMNTAPRGNIAVEDQRITADQLRAFERSLAARGAEHWTWAAVEREHGTLVGFTDAIIASGSPWLVTQANTGVLPAYRGKGLARWLKAEMLARLLVAKPGVRFIRTANADSNAAMVRINEQLGFQPYSSQTMWQMELAE